MKLKIALALFPPVELKLLGQALDSQLLGNPPAIAECFSTCIGLQEENPNWGEAELLHRLYPGKDYRAYIGYLRTRTSALLGFIQLFLAHKVFLKDALLQDHCLIAALRSRKWEHEHNYVYKKALERIEKTPLRGFAHNAFHVSNFEDLIQTGEIYPYSPTTPWVQSAMDSLDSAYFLKKLSMACNAASFDREFKTRHQFHFMLDERFWLKNKHLDSDPMIRLFHLLLIITTSTSPKSDLNYERAKDLFFEHSKQMAISCLPEAQDALKHLINYCAIRYNQKAESFRREIAAIYKKAIDSEILLTEGKIQSLDFINAFTAFLFSKDEKNSKWLFLRFGSKIIGDAANATRHYCKGCEFFSVRKFLEADEAFFDAYNSRPQNPWPPFEANIYVQLARTKYILKDFDKAEAFAKSLLKNITEKGNLDESKTFAFGTFCSLLIQLCKAQRLIGKRREQVIESLKRKHKQTGKAYFASTWITEQVGLL